MAEDQPGECEPVCLTLDDILELHGLIIGATAAEAADQLRNRHGLARTLARPETCARTDDPNAIGAEILGELRDGDERVNAS